MSEGPGSSDSPASQRRPDLVVRVVRSLTLAMAAVGGLGVVAMMLVTCLDVIGRAFGHPLTGAFDLVRAAAVLSIAGALPLTTAVKGHVSIEFLYHKLGRLGRRGVQALVGLMTMAMFGLLAWKCVELGLDYRRAGEVTSTLQIPVFWMPWVIAASCAVTVAVLLHQLLRPGQEVVKP
jgi:TRAP-type C4-dicarboxylate transport system permease small subunit